MGIKLAFVDNLPDKPAFQALLVEFFEIMLKKLTDIGGVQLSPKAIAAQSVAHMDDYLPLKGPHIAGPWPRWPASGLRCDPHDPPGCGRA